MMHRLIVIGLARELEKNSDCLRRQNGNLRQEEEIRVKDTGFPGAIITLILDGLRTIPGIKPIMWVKKRPNELGLYDMNGNVWEWVNDWYDEAYYASSPSDNPKGPENGQFKLMRGGSWNNSPDACSVCYRNCHKPDSRKGTYGFRIAGDSLDLSQSIVNNDITPYNNKTLRYNI